MSEDYKIVHSSNGVRETANTVEILLANAAAVSEIPEGYAPGSIAYTADMSFIAMLDIDGVWKEIE